MNHTKDNGKIQRIVEWIVLSAGCFYLLCILRESFHPAILGDETFSMKLAERSYGDIVRLTARDVHPPLYYWILKTVVSLGRAFSVDPVMLGKLTSVIPWFLLAAVAFGKMRKELEGAAAVYFLCITGMPQMMRYAVEIRMYGWGMCFLVFAYLAFCDAVRGTGSKWCYVRFGLFSLMAAYTHYFSCVAAACLFIGMALYFMLHRRADLKKWLVSVFIAVIGYVPWLPVVCRQIGTVREQYWIEEISLHTLFSFFQFIFNPKVYRWHSGTILGLLTFLLLMGVVALPLLRKDGEDRTDGFCAAAGAVVILFIIVIGVLASVFMKPVLVQRYLFFGFGTLWLGFAIALSKIKSPPVRIGIMLFLLCATGMNLTHFTRVERESREGWRQMEAVLDAMGEDDVILANLGQTRLALSYDRPETEVCYYWRQQTESLYHELYGNLTDTRDEQEILSHLTDQNEIYFFDTVDIDEFHFKEDCTDRNIIFEDMGTCCIEDVIVRVYIIRRGE